MTFDMIGCDFELTNHIRLMYYVKDQQNNLSEKEKKTDPTMN